MGNQSDTTLTRGVFCISVDTELLWGRHDTRYQSFIQRTAREREIINKLLILFKQYDIGATWAVVGHLFLNKCKKEGGKIHPDIKRPSFGWVKGDWLRCDPGTSVKKNPCWYGSDIIKMIQKDKNQEIGSHSFSHIIFGDKGCTKKCAESEIKKCVELAKKENIELYSFVFPRNSIGHLDILKKYQLKTFRGEDDYSLPTQGVIGKIYQLLDLLFLIPHASTPRLTKGLLEIPGSMYFLSSRGWRKLLPEKIRIWKAQASIRKAVKEKKVFHLWFHPVDLADNSISLLKTLEQILRYAKKEQKKGGLDILSMQQISTKYSR